VRISDRIRGRSNRWENPDVRAEAQNVELPPTAKRFSAMFPIVLPEEGTQIPMFRLLGTPDAQKRRVVYDTGHNIPRPDLIRESLDWLDTHLGPVRQP